MKKKQESEGLCATPVKNDDGHEGKTSDLEAMRTYHVYVMASRSRVLYVASRMTFPGA